MANDFQSMKYLSNIGLMMTYRCSISCPHCIVEAGPNRTEMIPLEECLDLISQIRSYRDGYIRGLALTGGEPFFNLPVLKVVSETAAKKGFVVSAVTNAFWAESPKAAQQILSGLPFISLLAISTDEYHQKIIPFQYIRNAVEACNATGKYFSIAICTDTDVNPIYQCIMDDLREFVNEDQIRISITFPVGRAKLHADGFHYSESSEPCESACTMASSPVIFPDGKVFGCIGPVIRIKNNHPLYLGNLNNDPLSVIFAQAERNVALHAIRIWGPKYLVSLLHENGFEALLPKKYMKDCMCDVCYKLFSNPILVAAIESLVSDETFGDKVAYGRLYYLNESDMLEYRCQST